MRCLWRSCSADLNPEPRQTRPGSAETHWVYPFHQVVGENSWFGTCPGSQIELLTNGTISAAAVDVLTAANEHLFTMLRDRIRKATEAYDELAAAGDPTKTHPDRMPHGRPVVGPVEDYFPGRPADAPEPGPGDPPIEQPPEGVAAIPVRSIPLESMRDQLKALAMITAEGFSEAEREALQILLSTAAASEIVGELKSKLASTRTIAGAAVGSSRDVPHEALSMIGHCSIAMGGAEEIDAALVTLHNHVQEVLKQIQAGHTAAQTYARSL